MTMINEKPLKLRNVLLTLGGVLALLVMWANQGQHSAPSQPMTPADRTFAEGLLHAQTMTRVLKQNMRNPDSFTVRKAYVMDDGAVCVEYTAQNGFGGFNRESVVYAGGQLLQETDDQFRRVWNRDCADRTGRDVVAFVSR